MKKSVMKCEFTGMGIYLKAFVVQLHNQSTFSENTARVRPPSTKYRGSKFGFPSTPCPSPSRLSWPTSPPESWQQVRLHPLHRGHHHLPRAGRLHPLSCDSKSSSTLHTVVITVLPELVDISPWVGAASPAPPSTPWSSPSPSSWSTPPPELWQQVQLRPSHRGHHHPS